MTKYTDNVLNDVHVGRLRAAIMWEYPVTLSRVINVLFIA